MGCQTESTTHVQLIDEVDSVSYAVGIFLGENYRTQEVTLNPDLIYEGIQHGMADHPRLIDDSLTRQLITKLEEETRRRQEERMSRLAAENMAAARAFLEENRTRDSITELPSGLQYRILKAGTGASPTLNNEVLLTYEARLLDGTVFDQSERTGGSVVLRVDEVIRGWTEALTNMKPGARWELYIPPDLAYGEKGRIPLVPPQSLLIFKIELIEILR